MVKIDADRLKAEIKRRRLHFNKEAEKYQALNNGYSQNCYGARDALRDLENFLDSLQQEQPSEELEAEIGKVFFSQRFEDEHGRFSIQLSLEEFSDIAKHFYELGKQSKEPVSEGLEKYASRAGFDYVDDIELKYPGHRWNDHDVEYAYRDGIIAGAEWQKSQMIRDCSVQASYEAEIEKAEERGYNLCKEQMMKDAVKGEVVGQEQDIVEGHHYLRNIIKLNNSDLIGVEFGDKVKIVILKEDSK